MDQFARTQLIYGKEAMKKFEASRVAVFGIGGVGGYVVEALARTGIGALDLIDDDKVCLTNLNRQIIATRKTIGKYKVEVARERISEIAPDCQVRTYQTFYLPETADQFDFTEYDYIVDAIDTVTGKLTIIENAKKAGVPVISSMGAGNKVNPAAFEVADIYETSICPLAKVMRRECRKRGIESLKVVYSKEPPRERLPYRFALNRMFAREAVPKAIVLCLLSIAFAGSTSYLVLYGNLLGIEGMGTYFVVYALCLVATRPLFGKMADRFGAPRVLVVGVMFFAASYVMLWQVRDFAGMIAVAVVGSAGFAASRWPSARCRLSAVARRATPRSRGSIWEC